MQVDDVRKLMEVAVDKLTPAKARELAKQMMEGANREQLQKTQHDLLEWSQRSRDRVTSVVRAEVTRQMKNAGFATRSELEALRKRVRDLEGGPKKTAKKSTKSTKKSTRTPTKSGGASGRTTKSASTSRDATSTRSGSASPGGEGGTGSGGSSGDGS